MKLGVIAKDTSNVQQSIWKINDKVSTHSSLEGTPRNTNVHVISVKNKHNTENSNRIYDNSKFNCLIGDTI